jgi:DhnA family fructose-bisphosphate aldolase class Ia
MDEGTRRMLADTRARNPHSIADAAAKRRRRPLLDGRRRLLLIAADHPARAAFAVGDRPAAMASRLDLLDRLLVALSRPGVDGVLGTPDVIEDLLLLRALDGKVVICSMNRGGLPGSAFELDDRFTAYDAATIAAMGFDGGKMLLRIDPEEPATVDTLAGCARAVNELADHRLMAMVEPFWAGRTADGRSRNDLDPDQMMRAIAVAQALGRTSAYTWLKVPVVADMARVMEATTLPTVLLGGDPAGDPSDTYQAWAKALELPQVYGLTVGRTVLYPPDDDVAAAVDAAAALL